MLISERALWLISLYAGTPASVGDSYELDGFPTIFFVPASESEETTERGNIDSPFRYEGPRDAAAMAKYARKNARSGMPVERRGAGGGVGRTGLHGELRR